MPEIKLGSPTKHPSCACEHEEKNLNFLVKQTGFLILFRKKAGCRELHRL
jgi:hypothetical protein